MAHPGRLARRPTALGTGAQTVRRSEPGPCSRLAGFSPGCHGQKWQRSVVSGTTGHGHSAQTGRISMKSAQRTHNDLLLVHQAAKDNSGSRRAHREPLLSVRGLVSGRSAPHRAAHGGSPFVPSRLAAPGAKPMPRCCQSSFNLRLRRSREQGDPARALSVDRSQGWGTGSQEARHSDPKSSGKLSSVGTCQVRKRWALGC